MSKELTYILALLVLSTGLVVLMGIVVLRIDYTVKNPEPFGCAVVIDEQSTYSPDHPGRRIIDHPGRDIFENNCAACHAVNQVVVGPALRGISERRDSLWIVQMIRNSEQLIASGDSTAVGLYREYNKTRMPAYEHLSDSSIQLIIEYIDLESEQRLTVPVTAPMPATL
jgi:cytochrome c551/c552